LTTASIGTIRRTDCPTLRKYIAILKATYPFQHRESPNIACSLAQKEKENSKNVPPTKRLRTIGNAGYAGEVNRCATIQKSGIHEQLIPKKTCSTIHIV